MTECPRFGKWFRACRFEARYDEVKQRRELGFGSDWFWETITIDGKQKLTSKHPTDTKTYVRDVCVRCGKTVARP